MLSEVKREQKRAAAIIAKLKEGYPDAHIALVSGSPFELLIATILSAQCTDARVNIVTKSLFLKYRCPADYLSVSSSELENDIFSTGFYRQKAKNIRECCAVLIEKYNGSLPVDFDLLTQLPGVGRKTASVIMSNAFGVPALAVDTHVRRISNLLGFIADDSPEKIEERLKELLPPEDWGISSHLIATHGRNICIARRPKCSQCIIAGLCPSKQIASGK